MKTSKLANRLVIAAGAITLLLAMTFASNPTVTAAPDEGGAGQWNRVVVDSANDVGMSASIAIKPLPGYQGQPFVSYWDATKGWLKYAYYKGSVGGNCSQSWSCGYADQSGSSGEYTSLAFKSDGTAALAYSDPFKGAIKLKTIPANQLDWSAPSAQILDQNCAPGHPCVPGFTGQTKFSSVAWTNAGPRVAYWMYDDYNGNQPGQNHTSSALRSTLSQGSEHVASIEDWGGVPPYTIGYFPSIGMSNNGSGLLRVAFRGRALAGYVSQTLNFAERVGFQMGTCEEPETASYWDCQVVDGTPGAGNWISLHAPETYNYPHDAIAYYHAQSHQLRIAWHTGKNSDVCIAGNPGWRCDIIETVGTDSAMGVGLTFYQGNALIAYYDKDDYSNGILKLARWVGQGGNCGQGVAAHAWQCSIVDRGTVPLQAAHSVGKYASIAVNLDGQVFIAYYDETSGDLKVASEKSTVKPSFIKSYSPGTLGVGGTTTVTYKISNNLATDGLSELYMLDPMSGQSGVQVVSNTCGGTADFLTGNNIFVLLHGVVGKKGGASASCTITAKFKALKTGTYSDVVTLKSNQAENVTAQAVLTINNAPPPTNAPTATPTKTATSSKTPTKTATPSKTPTKTVIPSKTPTKTATVPSCNAKPAAPSLDAPKDGKVITTKTSVLLKWFAVTCAETYKVNIRKNSASGNTVDGAANLSGTQYQTIQFVKGKTYFWQVKACNKQGCTVSNQRKFTIQ